MIGIRILKTISQINNTELDYFNEIFQRLWNTNGILIIKLLL